MSKVRRGLGDGWQILVLAVVLALPPIAASTVLAAEQITPILGRVVGVHDGDTITVRTQTNQTIKVRLLGIDAPELGQPFGTKSKQALSGMVFGKDVLIGSTGEDRYGRVLGDIRAGQVWANLAMVNLGMAWHYVKYDKRPELSAAEFEARSNRRGLWAAPNAVAPWDWRRKGK